MKSILLTTLLLAVLFSISLGGETLTNEFMQREFEEQGITMEKLIKGENLPSKALPTLKSPLCSDWVVFIGDSITRNMFVEYIKLFQNPSLASAEYEQFKGQRDFDYTFSPSAPVAETFSDFPGTHTFPTNMLCNGDQPRRVSFYWRPFVSDLTSFLRSLPPSPLPSLLICSVGSWDLLHINNAQTFNNDLASLRSAFFALPSPIPSTFLTVGSFNVEALSPSKANLTNIGAESFNRILNLYFTGPSITILDKFTFLSHYPLSLSDGVHPSSSLTSFLLQIWLNSLPSSYPFSAKLSQTSKAEGFVGKDPILGAFVGLYILGVFVTRDPFLISNFILLLSSRIFRN